MAEMWESIEEAPGYYVSSAGKILGRRGRLMTLCRNRGGYSVVSPFIGGKTIYRQVHRLVAQAFIPNPESLPVVNHIDGNRENNTIENLEWVTHQENANKIVNPALDNRRRSKRVVRLSPDGAVICEWPSIKDAAQNSDVSPQTIATWAQSETNRYRFAHELDDRPDESWRQVHGHGMGGQVVEVSDHGRIRTPDGQILVGRNRNEYMFYRDVGVHRLVAREFLPNPENKPNVNHLDGNTRNNCAVNLEWVTQQENCVHAHATGLCRRRPVKYIDPDGTTREFESIKAACLETYAYAPDIVRACRTGVTLARDRRWEYIGLQPEGARREVDLMIAPENHLTDAELCELFEELGLSFD